MNCKVCSPLLLALALTASAASDEAAGPRPWTEYRTIMWIGDTAYRQPAKVPLFFERLREMGINTAMVAGNTDARTVTSNGLPYYVENMVNRGLCLKWNSKVTDWEQLVTEWAGGRPESGLVRDYCLDDLEWLNWAKTQMRQQARKYGQDRPVAYDIRDELSVTISANPFDYDFNPIALAGFRDWLKTQYADLAALNGAWQTQFATWDDVRPYTTDQIKHRMGSGKPWPPGRPDWSEVQHTRFRWAEARRSPTRWNFSPWADFRTYMDLSLARALARLREAAREVDRATPVGIEGTQMPHAFGGYDLWRLAQSVDWVEPYDIGNAREILGSFMAHPLMCTVFETETLPARRRLWHLLLEGDGGCIIWWSEDCIDWNSPDWTLTAKGRGLAPVLREMTSPLAALFLRAERQRDPVFIHYSQPSIQAAWLIESTVDGSTWLRRFSSFEAEHNHQVKVRNSWLKLFQDLGYSPRFLASEQIERGALRAVGAAAVVLPSSWAVSGQEATEIRAWLAAAENDAERTLLWNETPGVFDEHGRLRSESPFGGWFAPETASASAVAGRSEASHLRGDIADYQNARLSGTEESRRWVDWAMRQVRKLKLPVTVPAEARVRVHRFRSAAAELLAFECNINYQMSEDLKQGGGNELLEKPVEFTAALKERRHVYELRSGDYLGHVTEFRVGLHPWQPSLFALLPEKEATGDVVSSLLRGQEAAAKVSDRQRR